MTKAKKRRLRFALLLLVAIATLLLGSHFLWLMEATARRDAAWQRLRDAGIAPTLAELLAAVEPVPDELNPAIEYRRACSLLDYNDSTWANWYYYEFSDEPLSEEQETFAALDRAAVATYQNAIQAVAAADGKIRPTLVHTRADFGVWSERNGPVPADMMTVLLPHLQDARYVARLLAAEANVAARDGDGKRALHSVVRIIGIADALSSDSHTLVEHMVALGARGAAAQVVLRNPEVAAEAPVDLRVTVIELLLDDAQSTASFRSGIGGDATMAQAVLGEMEAGRSTGGGDAIGWLPRFFARPILRTQAGACVDYWIALRETVNEERLSAALDVIPEVREQRESRTESLESILSSLLMRSVKRAVEAEFRCRADRRLAAALLAIRAYQLDHGGEFPPDLAVLVPDYLPAVPIDPLASDGNLKYAPERGLLWSTGPDGIDHGGDESLARPNTKSLERRDIVVRLR